MTVEDGRTQLDGLGEETAGIALDGEVILLVVIETTLVERLVDAAEACGFYVRAEIERRDVRQVECRIGLGRPAAFLVEVGDF